MFIGTFIHHPPTFPHPLLENNEMKIMKCFYIFSTDQLQGWETE
jgi:hypothetical protein